MAAKNAIVACVVIAIGSATLYGTSFAWSSPCMLGPGQCLPSDLSCNVTSLEVGTGFSFLLAAQASATCVLPAANNSVFLNVSGCPVFDGHARDDVESWIAAHPPPFPTTLPINVEDGRCSPPNLSVLVGEVWFGVLMFTGLGACCVCAGAAGIVGSVRDRFATGTVVPPDERAATTAERPLLGPDGDEDALPVEPHATVITD